MSYYVLVGGPQRKGADVLKYFEREQTLNLVIGRRRTMLRRVLT